MTIGFTAIRDALVTHAQTTAKFDSTSKHEPLVKPNGLHLALWLDSVTPVNSSGLAATTVRLAFVSRIYLNAEQQPVDNVDTQVLGATDALLAAWSGDLTLGDQVRHVDVLGAYGIPLGAQAGYQRIGDTQFRVMTITTPMVINDVWAQEA